MFLNGKKNVHNGKSINLPHLLSLYNKIVLPYFHGVRVLRTVLMGKVVLLLHSGVTEPISSVVQRIERIQDVSKVVARDVSREAASHMEMEAADLIVILFFSKHGQNLIRFMQASAYFHKCLVFINEKFTTEVGDFSGCMQVLYLSFNLSKIISSLKVHLNPVTMSANSNIQRVSLHTDVFYPAQANGLGVSRLALPTTKGAEFILLDEIGYVQSVRNDVVVHPRNAAKKPFLALLSLKKFEEITLKLHFSRIHQSYSVNINAIKTYVKGDGGYVILESGKELQVSRGKKEAFLTKIMPWRIENGL